MKTKLAFLVAALIFVAGSVTYLRSTETPNQPSVGRSFVVTFSHYRRSTPTQRQTIIQLVNAQQGRSLVRRINRDGRDVEHVVHQYAPKAWAASLDRAAFQRSTYVTHTEQFLGLTVYVLRQDVGGQMLESWHAPETGAVPLKQILEIENGDALITEAISLEFREVSDQELAPQASLLWESSKS